MFLSSPPTTSVPLLVLVLLATALPAALAAVPVLTSVSPERTPLGGTRVFFSGTGFDPAMEVVLDFVLLEPEDVTVFPNGTASVLLPRMGNKGYYDVSLENPGEEPVVYERRIFYSNDCLEEGTFGLDGECEECPKGGICPGGNRLWPATGYWSPAEEAGYVVACQPDVRCAGGRTTHGANTCAPGYFGDNCGGCQEGFYRLGDTCELCTGQGAITITVIINMAVLGALLLSFFLLSDALLATFVSALLALQVVSAVGRMAGYQQVEAIRTFYQFLAVVTLDVEAARPGCEGTYGNNTIVGMFYGNLLLVLACLIVVGIGMPILGAIFRGRARFFRFRRWAATIAVFTVFYYILTLRAMQVVFCRRIGKDDYMVAEPRQLCYTDGHMLPAVIAYVILIFVTLGMPLIMSSKLPKARDRLWDDPEYLAKFGILYESFKPEHFLFGACTFFVDIVLAMGKGIFPYTPIAQAISACFVLVVYILFLIFKRPFSSKLENFATMAAFGAATLAAICNAILTTAAETEFSSEISDVSTALEADESKNEAVDPDDSPALFGLSITVIVLTCFVLLGYCFLFGILTRKLCKGEPKEVDEDGNPVGPVRPELSPDGLPRDVELDDIDAMVADADAAEMDELEAQKAGTSQGSAAMRGARGGARGGAVRGGRGGGRGAAYRAEQPPLAQASAGDADAAARSGSATRGARGGRRPSSGGAPGGAGRGAPRGGGAGRGAPRGGGAPGGAGRGAPRGGGAPGGAGRGAPRGGGAPAQPRKQRF